MSLSKRTRLLSLSLVLPFDHFFFLAFPPPPPSFFFGALAGAFEAFVSFFAPILGAVLEKKGRGLRVLL